MRKEGAVKNIDLNDGYVPALDGVRGYAVLMVLLVHTMGIFIERNGHLTETFVVAMNKIVMLGRYGVDLFFVLSGFLITGILIKSAAKKEKYFKNFYVRRMLRIFPLYYAYLLSIIFLLPVLVDYTKINLNMLVIYMFYLQNAIVLIGGTLQEYLLGHFWSLAVEEHFYLAWPFIVRFLKPSKQVVVSISLILLAIAFRAWFVYFSGMRTGGIEYYVGRFTLCKVDGIILGCMLALGVRNKAISLMLEANKYLFLIVSLVTVAVAETVYMAGGYLKAYNVYGGLLYGILFSAIINLVMFAEVDCLANKIFDNRLLRLFGKHSYAIYVIHVPISAWIYTSFFSEMPTSVIISGAKFFLITTFVALIVSILIWHAYEKHFIKMKALFDS